MSNGNGNERRDKVLAPIRVGEVEDWRLRAAAELDARKFEERFGVALSFATWLRNLGLKRADELDIPSEPPTRKKVAR